MIYGARIVQARELHALTQVELADQADITRASLAAYEVGRAQPTVDALERISRIVDFPHEFFEDPVVEHFAMGTLQFRARASMSAKQRNQAYQAARTVYEVYERLEAHVKPIALGISKVSGDPEQAAIAVRSQLGIAPDTPISHLLMAMERAGIVVQALPMALEKRDGFSAMAAHGQRLRPVITLPAGLLGDRQRLTAAHELGEMVLEHEHSGKQKEDACNRFAGALLMPRNVMLRELQRPINLTLLAMLKQRWGVSIQALLMRSQHLELISPRQYRLLWQQIGARGWRKREPPELDVLPERPRALRKMAELRYGNPIDVRRFASEMKLGLGFAKSLLFAHAEAPAANARVDFDARLIDLEARRRDRENIGQVETEAEEL